MGLSFWHILIVVLLVVLLFGGNKISTLMGDVAKGIKSFKKGMEDEPAKPVEPKQLASQPGTPVEPRKDDAHV
jgi:sec-independent protein translocase protein TatA